MVTKTKLTHIDLRNYRDEPLAVFNVGEFYALTNPRNLETSTVQLMSVEHIEDETCKGYYFVVRIVGPTGELGPAFRAAPIALHRFGKRIDLKFETFLPKDERKVIVQGDYLDYWE